MPVFNTSLPLDCRDSSAAWLLLKPGKLSQTLQLKSGIQETGMLNPLWLWPPLTHVFGHLYFGSIDGQAETKRAQHKAPCQPSVRAVCPWFDVPQRAFLTSKCLCVCLCVCICSPYSLSFAFLLTRDSFAVFQPWQRHQWRGERDTSLSGQCCTKFPPASRHQHPWQTHQDVSCLASAEHEPGKGWGHPWQRNSRGKSKVISVQTTTFPVLG